MWIGACAGSAPSIARSLMSMVEMADGLNATFMPVIFRRPISQQRFTSHFCLLRMHMVPRRVVPRSYWQTEHEHAIASKADHHSNHCEYRPIPKSLDPDKCGIDRNSFVLLTGKDLSTLIEKLLSHSCHYSIPPTTTATAIVYALPTQVFQLHPLGCCPATAAPDRISG